MLHNSLDLLREYCLKAGENQRQELDYGKCSMQLLHITDISGAGLSAVLYHIRHFIGTGHSFF